MHNKQGEALEYVLHDADRDDVLVIFAHGLTGNMDREMCSELAGRLAARGWPTLRFSFSGHGNSEGDFAEMTISKEVDDLQTILDQFKGSKKIAYIGHSMGGAVGALTAAKDDRLDVLISLAGMVHTKQFYEQEFSEQEAGASVMWEKEECPLSVAFQQDLCSIDSIVPAVKDVRVPWLLIHGAEDDVVLPSHSADLFEVLKGPKKNVVYERADHHFEQQYEQITEEIDAWLKQKLPST